MESTTTVASKGDKKLASGAAARCPMHSLPDDRKTAPVREPSGGPVFERNKKGTYVVRSYALARQVLRSPDVAQAGFGVETLSKLPNKMKMPILFQEGKVHHEQRKATAKFFTPRAVSERYRTLMVEMADRLIEDLRQTKRADLSQVSMALAVEVASQIVGLTEHKKSGMHRRLESFFNRKMPENYRSPKAIWWMLRNNLSMGMFYYLDVNPNIKLRKAQPGEDVISHLLAQGYSNSNILIECITYAAAGMVTTREFISVAAWRMLEDAALRARYVAADEAERRSILEEILRLEPIVGHLFRRATADVSLEDDGVVNTIPAGSLIQVAVDAANTDEVAVGHCPFHFRGDREPVDARTPREAMSFGDGAHRCPGAYVALQETDIFLQRLCALPGLRLEKGPKLGWNPMVGGYELRECMIRVD